MQRILMLLALATAVTTADEVRAHSGSGSDAGRWVCNAYGYGGSRNAWRSVTGERSSDRGSAVESAMAECRKTHNGCQRSGCWPG
jgi:hypothetical protein